MYFSHLKEDLTKIYKCFLGFNIAVRQPFPSALHSFNHTSAAVPATICIVSQISCLGQMFSGCLMAIDTNVVYACIFSAFFQVVNIRLAVSTRGELTVIYRDNCLIQSHIKRPELSLLKVS